MNWQLPIFLGAPRVISAPIVESMIEETLDEFERLFNQLPKEFAHAVLGVLEVEFQQALSRMRARID